MEWLIGPIVGAVIGCFTNYIAVKMLFHPYKEIRIFGFRLPFTPGMVPKRKTDIARAIGRVVNDYLLQKDDILEALTKQELVDKINGEILDYRIEFSDEFMQSLDEKTIEDPDGTVVEEIPRNTPGNTIAGVISHIDIRTIVSNEIAKYARQKIQGSMMAMFVGDQMIDELSGQAGEWLQTYLQNDGRQMIGKTIDKELAGLQDMQVKEILEKYQVEEEKITGFVDSKYREVVNNNYEMLLAEIDFAGIIEKKINDMDMKELEELLLAVMKKELNAIVYLGALIGFVIGFLNVLL
jgi:uncharacterized membrane protein YheB (UPF0754 family)